MYEWSIIAPISGTDFRRAAQASENDMRFLSALTPREGQFFALFNKLANLTVEGARPCPTYCRTTTTSTGGPLDSDDSGCRTHGAAVEIGSCRAVRQRHRFLK